MRRSSERSGAPPTRRATLAILVVAGLVLGPGAPAISATTRSSGVFAVAATRELLTMSSRSPVAHDNEVMALAAHSGRLFAATDQWEYSGPSPSGQVLVKASGHSSWTVFQHTESLRVQALDSFPIPRDQGLGPGHSLLISQAIINGRSQIEWLLDGGKAFTPRDSYALASTGADVRSFGAHESGGVWAIYAGVASTGILRGIWSRSRHTLVFASKPELCSSSFRFFISHAIKPDIGASTVCPPWQLPCALEHSASH